MECTVLLKRNDTIIDGQPKSPSSLEHGEMALNYSSGKETIFVKNTNDKIISFDLNSTKQLENSVVDDEEVVANAISKIVDASGITKSDGAIGYECNGTNYLSSSKSIIEALKILDSKIKEIETRQ